MGYDSTIPLRDFSVTERLRFLFDSLAEKYNVTEFIADDPVQFPRRFTAQPDVEIAAILCATIAWGKRSMICRDCDRLLSLLGNEPAHFTLHGDIDAIPDANIHRTFFGPNLRHWLRALRLIYRRHGSLEAFAAACGAPASELPAWTLAQALGAALAEANGGTADARCLPLNIDKSALKRLNMALRWLVRDDGIVDIGCWKVIKPSQLIIPLDVHVGNTARSLGIITRKANDRAAALAITDVLRRMRPDDPVVYDFALFGYGVTHSGEPLNLPAASPSAP